MDPQWVRDFAQSRVLTCLPSTIRAYTQALNAFADWIGERPLDDTTIQIHLAELLARGLAEETVRGRRRMLKTFCRWLVRRELLAVDPFRDRTTVPPIRHKRVRRRTYSDAEVVQLLTAARPQAINKRNPELRRERWDPAGALAREQAQGRALVLLLVDSAMRAGEVCALNCGDVRRWPLVIRSKGGHRDLAFMTEVTRAALVDLAGDRPDSAPLFRHWKGGRCTPASLRNILARLAERAGVTLPDRPLHAFRHYAAQAWVKAGLADLTIQHLMRHEQITTTQIYTRAIADDPELAEIHRKASPVGRLLAAAERVEK
jgi:integrase